MENEENYWKVEKFLPEHNPHGMLEESEFSMLFPKYREKYLMGVWPAIERELAKHHLTCTLDVINGVVAVKNSKKTYDPYIILKARDMLKLLARSVPYEEAVKILEDEVFCEVIKIKNTTQNQARFVKRRGRLIGTNGTTLKALQKLTNCYIRVQGGTVTVVGNYKGIRTVKEVAEGTMANVHPIYHIKELMVKSELAKDEKYANEDWSRLVPKYVPQKESSADKNKKKKKIKNKSKKKEYTPFPPPQPESKVDQQLASGEYFINQMNNKKNKGVKKEDKKKNIRTSDEQRVKSAEKKLEKLKKYQPPVTTDKKE